MIEIEKEIYMSRISKYLLLSALIVFVLACNFVTQPVKDVQNLASTAESLATAFPIETLQALPSAMPDIEIPTGMPDIGNVTNPQDAPLTEWNGIPIPLAATSGGESAGLYSFKAGASTTEIYDFYKSEMANLGWSEVFTMPDTGSGALLTYEKEDHISTITITVDGDGSLTFLTYQ